VTQQTTSLPTVEWADDDVYQVFCLCYARGRTRHVLDNFMIRDMHDGPMPLDYNVWIIRNRHRTILVDSGFSPRHAEERGRPLDFNLLEGLAKLGLPPEEIEHVVITHLHYDHAGNIDGFPKAVFHVQDSEMAFATGRCLCVPQIRWAYDVEDVVAMVRRVYTDRAVFHDGDDKLFPGVDLYGLNGHAAGVQGVKVNTPRGPIFLISDSSHYFANFATNRPFVLTLDAQQTLRTYRRIWEIGGTIDRIVPGHDPKIRRFYPGCTVNGLYLSLLHEQPRPFTVEEAARTDDFAGLEN
jgi:glyoxylase-like metal-dependent hydrolase (beta-lactamase superfamily II)